MIAAAGRALTEACTTLPFAYGQPQLAGRLKLRPEDFEVEEQLGFEPDGQGEHVFVYLEKRGLSTPDAQLELSRALHLHPRDIAYSGMKDKQALTRQWFSLHLPKGDPALEACNTERMRVLRAVRNSRKLRRGSHMANRFRIRLQSCTGARDWLELRLQQVAGKGVPNYFGPQRFGNGCSSLLQALEWFRGRLQVRKRTQRSLLLSAARAFLFNQVVAARVRRDTWNQVMDGEVLALQGSGSVFPAARAGVAEVGRRLEEMDLHPSGPLWGRGALMSTASCAQLEHVICTAWPTLAAGLEAQGLEQERRALRLQVQALQHAWDADTLQLDFTLAKGSFAT
ncbi:MAG: tRNA pseudouridine(13) synthase TruD, partial [Pseudohongiellaceae bacterium]